MNLLVILMFCSVTLAAYLVDGLRVIPSSLKLLPEAMSTIALLVVVARLLGGARIRLDWRYGLFFGLLLFDISFGFFAQSVSAGPIVGGLRFYLKALPFFLLPAVYPFTERQVKVQAMWMFLLMGLQAPVSFYQKYFQFRDKWHTGDYITGTVGSSGALTLIMVCGIAALVVLYLRDKVRLIPFVLGVGLLLAPTTIDETKITILLLPIVILLPALFMPRGQRSMRKLVPILVTGCVAGMSFLAVYAYFARFEKSGMELEQFFQNKKVLENYFYNKGNKQQSEDLGRFDTLVFAFRRLEQDPLVFGFGVGAGNASRSNLKQFEGKYAKYYRAYGVGYTQVGYWLWELGFVGLCTYLFFFFAAFRDAIFLARADSSLAPLGQAWATSLVIFGIALVYQSIFGMDVLEYPLWFYSGLCARTACELRASHAASHLSRASRVRGPATAV